MAQTGLTAQPCIHAKEQLTASRLTVGDDSKSAGLRGLAPQAETQLSVPTAPRCYAPDTGSVHSCEEAVRRFSQQNKP